MSAEADFFASFAETQNEPLHEELSPWVEEDGLFGPMLRHPLVYSVPLLHTGMANRQYEAKVTRLAEAEATEDWDTYVFLHERPHRFSALQEAMELSCGIPGDLIRSVWMDSENIWQHYDEWVDLLSECSGHGMMDAEELAALAELPETLTVYRGAQAGLNEDGLSWTLDRERAEWFATRFSPEEPILMAASVKKSAIVALLLGRGEDEVIVLPEALRAVSHEAL